MQKSGLNVLVLNMIYIAKVSIVFWARGWNNAVTDFDFNLISKIQAGDEPSFTRLVRSYTPYVYRTAFALIQDERDAEDVSQEVFLKIYRSINQLNDPRAFHTWLKKMITNTCLDRLKKRKPTPTTDSELETIAPDVGSDWDENLSIQEALQHLSHEYRITIVLRELQGYSYQEISDILGIPVGTVKSRIHTARTRLARLLGYQEYTEGSI